MEDSLEKLNIKIESLQRNLEDEIKRNKIQEETLYNITKQLHQTQESYLENSEQINLLKLEKKSILKEMDLLQKNKIELESFCAEQSIEIERGIILINNYLKK